MTEKELKASRGKEDALKAEVDNWKVKLLSHGRMKGLLMVQMLADQVLYGAQGAHEDDDAYAVGAGGAAEIERAVQEAITGHGA